MQSLGSFAAIATGIIVLVVVLFFYFLPYKIACNRNHSYAGLILFLNFISGFTILGWFLCLMAAMIDKAPENK